MPHPSPLQQRAKELIPRAEIITDQPTTSHTQKNVHAHTDTPIGTHTHTHTHIYIYIYIYRERERDKERAIKT